MVCDNRKPQTLEEILITRLSGFEQIGASAATDVPIINADGLAWELIARLLLEGDFVTFANKYRDDVEKRAAEKRTILDSLFSVVLQHEVEPLLNRWEQAQWRFFNALSDYAYSIRFSSGHVENSFPHAETVRLVPAIENYIADFQRLLCDIITLLSLEGSEDFFASVNEASAMELLINFGCEYESDRSSSDSHAQLILRPTVMSPLVLEAILRVCSDCTIYQNEALVSKGTKYDYFINAVETAVLALKNLDIRSFYNKRVYQFSVRYSDDGRLHYLGIPAGRQSSCNTIGLIRLIEKIWYIIRSTIVRPFKEEPDGEIVFDLTIHLVGRAQYSRLASFSKLIYTLCYDETFRNINNDHTFKEHISKFKQYKVHYIVYDYAKDSRASIEKEVCHYITKTTEDGIRAFPEFVFTARKEKPVNLKKVADVSRLFSGCRNAAIGNESIGHVFFILDSASLYSLDDLPAKTTTDSSRILKEIEDVGNYQYGNVTSTVANGRVPKSAFQSVVRWLTSRCVQSSLNKDMYQCVADMAVLKRMRSVISDAKDSPLLKACYVYYTHNEAIVAASLSNLNISRLEIYNGHRTGVIRLADNCFESSLCTTETAQNRLQILGNHREYEISLNLWQLIKLLSSDICQYLLRFDIFDRYSSAVIRNRILTPESDVDFNEDYEKEQALVYLFRKIYIRIGYQGLCAEGRPLDVELVNNRTLCEDILSDENFDFCEFQKQIEGLARSIISPAFAPYVYNKAPLQQMKREAMIRAIYGRAQSVEDMMLYSLYYNNPDWLLNGRHRIDLSRIPSTRIEERPNTPVYDRLNNLSKNSSFQQYDKSYYAYRMIHGDYGSLTPLDRQKIIQVSQENGQWDSPVKEYPQEEQLVSQNIRRCCKIFGYTDTALYENYSR